MIRTIHRINREYEPKCKCNVATEVIAAGIGAAGSIIGAGTSAIGQANLNKKNRQFALEESEKQREWSEKMYNEQNAWNYDMWQKENAYNSPAEQVKRLRDAGLNPMYYGLEGNGNASDLNAAQPLGYEQAQLVGQVNPYQGFGDVAMKIAQIANIQADTAKKNNENLTETQRREKMMAEIDVVKQELQNKIAEEGLTKTEREKLERDIAWLDRINSAVIAEKESNAKLNESQKKRIDELLEGEKIIQARTAEDFIHRWSKISAEIEKMSKETSLLQEDIENYALNHANNGIMGSGLSLPNMFRVFKDKRSKDEKKEDDIRKGDAMTTIVDNKY